MGVIPTVTFQILGPHQGDPDGFCSLWFKVKSDPPPTDDLVVGLKVSSANGVVRQSGAVIIPKHENHSADFYYRALEMLEVWLEIEHFDALAKLELPIFTNEGYFIAAGREFIPYNVGILSKIAPYQRNRPVRCLWTDQQR